MRCHAALALTCIVVATRVPHGLAQTQVPHARSTPTLNSQSTLVLVPALVRRKEGELVFTLNADDFILTDDGIPQKLMLEQDTGGEPLALVVLIEAGAATQSSDWHPGTRDARPPDPFARLPTMVEAIVGSVPHNIAVVGFDTQPVLLQEFTPDIDLIANTIHDLSVNVDGDGGAAILDSLGFSLDLLRKQPPSYRRAILLISETNDRGSHLKLEEALRTVSDTNTVIYSLGYSTGNAKAARYAYRELPTKLGNQCPPAPSGGFTILCLENANPGPPHGCMGKGDPNQDAPRNKASQAYDCLTQLVPPLAFAKMAAIAATNELQTNIPETVARLTGGEYFKLTNAKSLERDLATISNHIPNRYVLSFQPQASHPGFHAITLRVPNYVNLKVSARDGYWAETPAPPQP